MNAYTIGTQVRFTCTFLNEAGAVADPTTITVIAKARYGSPTTYTYPATVSKTSTGVYTCLVTPDAEGIWDVRFVGGGALIAVAETSVNVRDSQFYG